MKRKLVVALVLLFVASFAHAQSGCTLEFDTESIPEFFLGQQAHFDLGAIGGTPPYTIEITEDGSALPAGLHMNSQGKIRGKPTEVADVTVFFRVTDSGGCSLTQAYPVRVNP
jgi:hypothetical protein